MSRSLLSVSAFCISLAAVLIAIWFFQHGQGVVGLYNVFIAIAAVTTFVVVRSNK